MRRPRRAGRAVWAALAVVASLALGASAPPTGDAEKQDQAGDFTSGQLLVAAPDAADGHFARSVILMADHNAKGAFGLIVNRPIGTLSARRLLQQLGDDPERTDAIPGSIPLHYGGPVARTRVFVVHSTDFEGETTTAVNHKVAVTSSADVLRAIATGKGPKQSLVILGYAGWGPGQLEGELKRDFWVVAPFESAIVLDDQHDTKWQRALDRKGVDL